MQAPNAELLNRYGWTDKKEVRIPGRMFRSRAFIELSDTAKFILELFLYRRTWSVEGKGKNKKRIYKSRGLRLTYTEAECLWSINRRTFRDSIIQLIMHGFLRVEEQGGTLKGNRIPTIYMLVNDWEHYGTSLFIEPKISRTLGNDSIKRFNESRKAKFRVSPTSPDE